MVSTDEVPSRPPEDGHAQTANSFQDISSKPPFVAEWRAFVEHLGRCIYGGLFEEGSPLSDERGFRRDVLEAVRPLRVPILRWPGGNFVSGYHWLDGVGPRAERPRRVDLAWFAEESNRFGTDEFLQYCRAINTEPYICVNMGSGTMDEAQAWVEYANSTGNTHWANLRRKHGYRDPHRVKYWGLGNEMYGGWQIGALEAHEYVKKARAFAMVMKRMDPSIVLVGCGQNGWNPWDQVVLEGLARRQGRHHDLVPVAALASGFPEGIRLSVDGCKRAARLNLIAHQDSKGVVRFHRVFQGHS